MVRIPRCECPHMQKLFTIIGKKWALFILHSVQEGAHTKILTDRLAELVENKLLRKTDDGKYELTNIGNELASRLMEVAHWWGDLQCKDEK